MSFAGCKIRSASERNVLVYLANEKLSSFA